MTQTTAEIGLFDGSGFYAFTAGAVSSWTVQRVLADKLERLRNLPLAAIPKTSRTTSARTRGPKRIRCRSR